MQQKASVFVPPAPMGILRAPGSMSARAWLSDNRALFGGSVRRYPVGWLTEPLGATSPAGGERMPTPLAKRYRGSFKSPFTLRELLQRHIWRPFRS